MTYVILESRQAGATLITKVQYNFNEVSRIVDVSHFKPSSQEEVEQNIVNNSATVLAEMEAESAIQQLIPNLPINQERPIQ